MSGVWRGHGWRIRRNGWHFKFEHWKHVEPHKTKSRKIVT